MIISRTPFRISFFGGGTDYPNWYRKNGGSVLSTAIDKYCYITLRYLPPFFEHKIRLVYSKMEQCQHFDEIRHPAVRETLRFMNFTDNLEIHHDGDLPARSGMGSSSSFTVGLLNALYALRGQMSSPRRLARESIHIEQEMIKETVGSQDQIAAAHGGLNFVEFRQDDDIIVNPVIIPPARAQELSDHLMLFYTGIMRTASDVAESFVNDLEAKHDLLHRMNGMVRQGIDILCDGNDICRFGDLLNETWQAKKQLGDKVANPVVNDLYERARKAGALGGKLTGAGGGGFLLIFAPPARHSEVRSELKELLHIPFNFDRTGSQIIFYDPRIDDYRDLEKEHSREAVNGFRELSSLKS